MRRRFSAIHETDENNPVKSSAKSHGELRENEDEINVRIARAGSIVREEAKRLLGQEKVVRKRLPVRVRSRLPDLMTHGLSEEEKNRLIEITDDTGKSLACLSPEIASRQKLPYRLASVALVRKGDRLLLHKRSDPRLGGAGCWDVHTAFILVGESGEDAALRILRAAGLEGIAVKYLGSAQSYDERHITVCYFTAELPPGLYPVKLSIPVTEGTEQGKHDKNEDEENIAEVLEVDADELAGITAEAPELFSRELLQAIKEGFVFGKGQRI